LAPRSHDKWCGTAAAATSPITKENTMDSSKVKIVYVITERSGKSFWNRIGIAFVNHDGSLNVRLDAVPVSGELHIRDYVPREDSAGTHHGIPGADMEIRASRDNGAHDSFADL
jgi:hypothetical protein